MGREPEPGAARITAIDPAGWPRGSGFAHGMAGAGRVLAVAGQIGWDPTTDASAPDDLVGQAAQALRNVLAVVKAAGGVPSDVIRLTWFITDGDAYAAGQGALGAAYRELFGGHYPAMSVVVVRALLEPRALVEIEATAVIP